MQVGKTIRFLGDRRRAQGLSLHFHDARQDVAGKSTPVESVRRRSDHHADGGAARSSAELRDDGQAENVPQRAFRESGPHPVQPLHPENGKSQGHSI